MDKKNKPSPPAVPPNVQIGLSQFSQYNGPVPPPQLLAEFEKIFPGATKQWFDLWRMQTESRLAREQMEMDIARAEQAATHQLARKEIHTERFGMLSGLVVALSGMGASVYFASINLVAGVTGMIAVLAALAGAFIYKGKK